MQILCLGRVRSICTRTTYLFTKLVLYTCSGIFFTPVIHYINKNNGDPLELEHCLTILDHHITKETMITPADFVDNHICGPMLNNYWPNNSHCLLVIDTLNNMKKAHYEQMQSEHIHDFRTFFQFLLILSGYPGTTDHRIHIQGPGGSMS